MDLQHSGHSYSTIMGSDLDRDGMFLELVADERSEAPVLEVFYSDVTRTFTVNTLEIASVPLDVIEELVREAQRRLPAAPEEAPDAATPTI